MKNPQSNAIVERLHQSIGNALRTRLYNAPPTIVARAEEVIESILHAAAYAFKSAVHGTLKATPGSLVFHRDMVLNIPFITNIVELSLCRQQVIDRKAIAENAKRIGFDYQPDQEVLMTVHKPDKLEPRWIGPFRIVCVHTNGTVTIRCTEYVTEKVNIRRIRPYRR